MAAKFTISDGESEPSEEVEEEEQQVFSGHTLTLPDLKIPGRVRGISESQASSSCRDEEFQARGEEEVGTPTDGAPFRGRSKSAPPALWAAKKYGQQLRRMSDEFDMCLLDKREMRKVKSAGTAKQMHHSKSWWSSLFSHQETEGENNHHENHSHRTE